MECDRFRELLDPYLSDELPGVDRREWRQHVLSCAECRARAVAVEPSLAAIAVPARVASPAEVETCVLAVRAMIHGRRLDRRLALRRRPVWLAAAALVVMVVGSVSLWGLRQGTAPVVSNDSALRATATTGATGSGPEIDVLMDGDDIRVYRLAADDANSTAVCFVVNPALEL